MSMPTPAQTSHRWCSAPGRCHTPHAVQAKSIERLVRGIRSGLSQQAPTGSKQNGQSKTVMRTPVSDERPFAGVV